MVTGKGKEEGEKIEVEVQEEESSSGLRVSVFTGSNTSHGKSAG